MKSEMSGIVTLKNVSKKFSSKNDNLLLFKDVNLIINEGESVSISGPSGSGKSTLLNIIALLERATSGEVIVNGKDISTLKDRELTLLRRSFAFMFQKTFLFPSWSVEENIMLPRLISGKKCNRQDINALVERLGLQGKLKQKTENLSGGEKSRVSLIRAIASDGVLIFADEPTGSLDRDNALKVEEELLSLVKDYGKSLLYVTHSNEFANRADKKYVIEDKTLKAIGN